MDMQQTKEAVRAPSKVETATAEPNTENKLFVGGCPPGSGEEDLRKVFEEHGEVEEVFIMRGGSRSGMVCAFVRFLTQESAQQAIDTIHGQVALPNAAEPLVVRWADAPGSRRRDSRDKGGKRNAGQGGGGKMDAGLGYNKNNPYSYGMELYTQPGFGAMSPYPYMAAYPLGNSNGFFAQGPQMGGGYAGGGYGQHPMVIMQQGMMQGMYGPQSPPSWQPTMPPMQPMASWGR